MGNATNDFASLCTYASCNYRKWDEIKNAKKIMIGQAIIVSPFRRKCHSGTESGEGSAIINT